MAEFVKKTALGGYKPVAGGPRDPECTHVILTLGEYDGLKREISSAQQAAKNAEYNADKKIHQIQSEAQSRITDAEKKIAKNTAEWEKKLAAEQQESALQRELNANLLRITKERANAERGLKPKKEHNGYVVLTSVEKESRYKDSFGHPRTITLWETAMETPYTVDFEAEQVRSLLQELFQEDEDERWPICRIGITGNYPGKYADMIQDKEWREDYEKYNVMLERWLRANYRRGYWELVFLHTKPLSVVPPDMRAGRGSVSLPLPCSLCALALNTETPRFARTGGLCSSPRPEPSDRGWVLWSSGFAAYAASGGTARTVPPPLSPVRLFISATLIKFAAPECRSEPGQTLPRI